MKNKLNQQIIPFFEQLQQEKSQDWRENILELTQIQFRLDSQIENPTYYRDLLSRLESLTENDAVELVIDSVGGDLDGCIAICDAIMSTPASVTGILVNRAYSAGAFIALCCDDLEVRPYARMMLHSYSGGFAGKDHEIDLDYNFNKNYIRNFLSSCCFGFLDEEELEAMFNGKDWWMDSSEIVERLQQRQEILDSLVDYDEDSDEHCEDCNCQKDIPPPEYNPDDVAFKIPVGNKIGEAYSS